MKWKKERNKGDKGCRYERNDAPMNFNGLCHWYNYIALTNVLLFVGVELQ
jgi:hypothetical protein